MRPGPFVVNVGPVFRARSPRPFTVAAPIPGLAVTDSRVPEDADVRVEVVLEPADDAIVARGRVRAPWVAACRRCLGEVTGEVDAAVRELYEDASDLVETYALRGEQLDLEPLARDAVLLALPQAPLCAEGCAGLCPECGADRNEAACGCDTGVRDERWAALDALRFDD